MKSHRNHRTPSGRVINVGGRHRPMGNLDDHPKLAKYVCRKELPAAPPVVDYFTSAKHALSDILANDRLGDCTAAGACHIVESVTAAAGAPVVLSAADAVEFYELSTGYNPHKPETDQGGNEITVLDYWKTHGLNGKGAHRIVGYASIDPSDVHLIRSATFLFGGLYFGCELPDQWLNVSGDGFLWDAGTPDDNNGHCFVGVGANDHGVQVDSWGMVGTITYAAIAKNCDRHVYGNLFAVLTEESINHAKKVSPSGLDWAALSADFATIG